MFSQQQISFIKQLITDRNKSLRHEVSDHLDNSLPVKKIDWGLIQQASQTTGVSSSSASIVDLTGATLTLSPGTWMIIGHFKSARGWINFGAGGTSLVRILCLVRDGDNTELERTFVDTVHDSSASDLIEHSPTITTVQSFDVETTVKLSGYVEVATGTDFASGFRTGSGDKSQYATITARRIG